MFENMLKIKDAEKNWKCWTNVLRKKLDTIPTHPQQAHWVRIILGKLDTIQYPHTNRGTALYLVYNGEIGFINQIAARRPTL